MNPFALTPEALQEPWRLWTGHLVHFDWGHALANLVAFAIPSFLARRPDRLRLGLSLLVIAPILSLLILPDLDGGQYRGASGLLCALWALVGLRLARRQNSPMVGILMLAALALKLTFETLAERGLLATDSAWQSLPVAHLWGTLLGLAAEATWEIGGRNRPKPLLPK
jgi:rhomboid family GlyGly-CTERM serine protease